MALKGINRIAWGTKLLLTTVLASLVDCISLCHILKAYHCSLSPNGCFNLPRAPHPPTPLPSHLPTPVDSICDITRAQKAIQKPAVFQVACRNSNEMIAN